MTETISDICTDFQNKLRYSELWKKSCHALNVNPCSPG